MWHQTLSSCHLTIPGETDTVVQNPSEHKKKPDAYKAKMQLKRNSDGTTVRDAVQNAPGRAKFAALRKHFVAHEEKFSTKCKYLFEPRHATSGTDKEFSQIRRTDGGKASNT